MQPLRLTPYTNSLPVPWACKIANLLEKIIQQLSVRAIFLVDMGYRDSQERRISGKKRVEETNG